MKSSDKNKRTNFENAWADALDNAEATPNSRVWQGINNELLNADNIRIKGYYRTYKTIAAASISLLLLAGTTFTYYYYSIPEQNKTSLSENSKNDSFRNDSSRNDSSQRDNSQNDNAINDGFEPESNKATSAQKNSNNQNTPNAPIFNEEIAGLNITEKANSLADNKERNNQVDLRSNTSEKDKSRGQSINTKNDNSIVPNSKISSDNTKDSNEIIADNEDGSQKNNQQDARIKQSVESAFKAVASDNYEIIRRQDIILIDNQQIPPSQLVVKQKVFNPPSYNNSTNTLPLEVKEKKAPKRDRTKKFYADLNVLTDYFNPNFEVSSPQVNQVVFEQLNSFTKSEINTSLLGQQNNPSVSFSYGINMGVQLSGKWILEGGVSYSNFNTQSQSNLTIADVNKGVTMPITLLNKPAINNDSFNSTLINLGSIYAVNNSFEFASIPLKAGYVIGINKINLILKAGINTGLFIRNEITANNDALEPYVNKPSDMSSPFRKVHMNGLLSNEINYALNQNYSFSLAANYRFALNPLTREGQDISSMPDAYGIGMVLRYHFN
jgi:hypothetical protein